MNRQTTVDIEALRQKLTRHVDIILDALEEAEQEAMQAGNAWEVACIAVEAATFLRADAGTLRDRAARLARQLGATWDQVADAAGISRQAAWEQWAYEPSDDGR